MPRDAEAEPHAAAALGRTEVVAEELGDLVRETVPLTLDHWRQQGKVRRGDRILSAVFGAGYTWGAAIYTI